MKGKLKTLGPYPPPVVAIKTISPVQMVQRAVMMMVTGQVGRLLRLLRISLRSFLTSRIISFCCFCSRSRAWIFAELVAPTVHSPLLNFDRPLIVSSLLHRLQPSSSSPVFFIVSSLLHQPSPSGLTYPSTTTISLPIPCPAS